MRLLCSLLEIKTFSNSPHGSLNLVILNILIMLMRERVMLMRVMLMREKGSGIYQLSDKKE